MLRTLSIENIAVIEKAKIDFDGGLNVLTGETGAGKSIVVDSINAVLGERTSKELVRTGSDFAFVSAFFENINATVCGELEKLGYTPEDDGSLLITRRISKDGRSSCRINGMPATVSVLHTLGKALVNIHGQHDSQSLLDPEQHYKFIDMLSGDSSVLSDYKAAFSRFLSVRRELKALTAAADSADKNTELLEYQIKELEEADIKIGEAQALNARKKVMDSAEEAAKAYSSALEAVNGDDENPGAESLLQSALESVVRFSELSPEIKKAAALLENAVDEIADAKSVIGGELSVLDFDPREREEIEERLDELFRLGKKYGDGEEKMLAYLDNAKRKLNSIVNNEEELEKLNDEYDKAYADVLAAAEKLTALRKKTAQKFAEDVKNQLAAAIEEANEQARSIKDEANEVLAQAHMEAGKIIEDAKRTGYEQGACNAREEYESKAEALEREYEQKKAQLEKEYNDLKAAIEPELVETITEVFRKITYTVAEDNKEIIIGLINGVMKNSDISNEFVIRVSPDDYRFLVNNQGKIYCAVSKEVNMDIVEDAAMKKNQCIIESDTGVYDCSLDIELNNLIRDIKLLSCTQ